MPMLRCQALGDGTLIVALALLLWVAPAAAQIGASCSATDGLSVDLTGNNVYCNSGTFSYPAYWFGSTMTGCGSSTAGLMQWTCSSVSPNNTMEYCNGASWTAICSGATSGTVSGGTQYQMGYYATSASTLSGDSEITSDANNVLDVTSAMITSNDPVLSLGQTWNSSGTTFTALNLTVTNSASAASSLLANFLVGGTSEFKVDESGDVTAQGYVRAGSAGSGFELNGANAISFPTSDNTATGASIAIGPGALSTQITSAAYQNTAMGYEAMGGGTMTTGAVNNVAIGYQANYTTNAYDGNVWIGYQAAYSAMGEYEVTIGYRAEYTNQGAGDAVIGYKAFYSGANSGNNAGAGYQAGLYTASGSASNTAVGYDALSTTSGAASSNLTGSFDTAVGAFALENAQGAAASDTGLGYSAGSTISTGSNNTVVGYEVASTTLATGSSNILIGTDSTTDTALSTTTSALGVGTGVKVGTADTTLGYYALNGTITNNLDNVAVGFDALRSVTTGSGNTAIGYQAGYAGSTPNTTGTDNTFVGYQAQANGANYSNSTALGNGAIITGSNLIVLGNSSISAIYAEVTGFSALSDRRHKKDIADLDLGLEFIDKLKPVSYRFNNGDETLRFGFIAQDVEQALPGELQELAKTTEPEHGVALITRDNDGERTYRLSYGELIAPIVKSIQEQKTKYNALKATSSALGSQIETLETDAARETAALKKQAEEIKQLRQVLAVRKMQGADAAP
jgi:trimeric autotransporter adhesin